MAGKSKLTKALFKKALPNSSCSYTQLAKMLGTHRFTLRNWMEKNPDMQELFDKQKEFMISECEDVLFEDIVNNRDSRWATWYLKVMTDKYNETSKIEHSGEVSLEVIILDNKKEKEDE